jgi:hypothetical protein
MFGYVNANRKELNDAQKNRYQGAYCGVCRRIREQSGNVSRLGLRYDMAFLSLLLSSLYEPEETGGEDFCAAHPLSKRAWFDNPYVRYAADMNVALAYYKALDDVRDEGSKAASLAASVLKKSLQYRCCQGCCLAALISIGTEEKSSGDPKPLWPPVSGNRRLHRPAEPAGAGKLSKPRSPRSLLRSADGRAAGI